MGFFQVTAEQPFVKPDTLIVVGSLEITNAMLMGVFVSILLTLFSLMLWKRAKLLPSKFQSAVEILFEAFINLLEMITGSRQKAEKILPLVGALFLYMGIGNIIGLVPGLTSITYNGMPLFRTPTNDFNTTFSIALAIIILTQIMSLKTFGLLGHVKKYFKFTEVIAGFRSGIGAGVLAIVDFLIGLLDIISEAAKVVSLSLRLFGNMYAGEVLAAILLGAFALAIPAPWLAMNILVGLLQAMVFGSLTAAYYALATEEPEFAAA